MYKDGRSLCRAEIVEVVDALHTELLNNINEAASTFTLSILTNKHDEILRPYEFSNQLLVIFSSGQMEMLPRGLFSKQIKDYLGVRYNAIKYWCVMPLLSGLSARTKQANNLFDHEPKA